MLSDNTSNVQVTTAAGVPIASDWAKAGTRTSALAAFALGASLVFLVGFAHISVVHNAAHDTRHTMNFPCH